MTSRIQRLFRDYVAESRLTVTSDERLIRETLYALEKEFGAEKVEGQYRFVRRNDPAFRGLDP